MAYQVAIVVLCALGVLLAAVALARLRRPESAGRSRPSPRTQGRQSPDQDGGVQGSGPRTPRVFVGAKGQIDDFVAELIAHDCCDRWHDRLIVTGYFAWARQHRIEPLPETIFLANLAKHPNVKRSRGERLKDANGKVVTTPTGSPIRPTYYTIAERPYAVVPRGVAMPAKPGSKPKQRKIAAESGAGVRGPNKRVQGPAKRVLGPGAQPKRIAA